MEAAWVLYNYSDDPNVAPSTGLNVLVDAALAALTPTPQYPMAKNTLGGLVEYAAVVGSIEIYEGVLGNFAVAIIPIKINLAGF